jgi:hypothetical protein
MEIDLKRKKEFILFFQKLQEQKDSFYTKEQLVKLKTYEALLFDCFLWKYRDSYLKLFVSFLNYNISGEEFSKQLINMRSNHIVEFNELMKQLQLMSQLEINFEFLNKFNLDLNAFGFADIIDLVDQNCDSFVSDELLLEIGGSREDGEIDENQLRERIEKAFLLIMFDK